MTQFKDKEGFLMKVDYVSNLLKMGLLILSKSRMEFFKTYTPDEARRIFENYDLEMFKNTIYSVEESYKKLRQFLNSEGEYADQEYLDKFENKKTYK